jgi:hypothetical protein
MSISVYEAIQKENKVNNKHGLYEFNINWKAEKLLGEEAYEITKTSLTLHYSPRRYVSPKIDIKKHIITKKITSDDVIELKPFFDVQGKSGDEIQNNLNRANHFVAKNMVTLFNIKKATYVVNDNFVVIQFETFEEAAKSDYLADFFEKFDVKESDREDLLKTYKW